MREKAVAGLIAICSALALVLAVPASATEGPANATLFYPCSTCHEALRLPGVTKVSPTHLKNLTLGRHSGLYCSTCHSPEGGMMKLVGGIEIAVPGLHPRSKLMEVNRLCARATLTCTPTTRCLRTGTQPSGARVRSSWSGGTRG